MTDFGEKIIWAISQEKMGRKQKKYENIQKSVNMERQMG